MDKQIKFKGKYWFYLEYYTYIKHSISEAIILNTIDNSFIISKELSIISLIKEIENSKKKGGLLIDFENIYTDDIYHSFFNNIRKKYMGDLISDKLFNKNPFQFPYEPTINNSIDTMAKSPDFLNKVLLSLNIYTTNSCKGNCKFCNLYYKQFNSCTKYTDGNYLSTKSLDNIFENKYINLNEINILGGNIPLYNNMSLLLNYLKEYQDISQAHFNIFNIDSINSQILSFFENKINITVDILSTSESNLAKLKKHIKYTTINFIISNTKSYELAIKYINLHKIKKFIFTPFYHNNILFFRKNVFLHKSDILSKKQTINQIHRNHFINTFYFGHLDIVPNGDVYGRLGESIVGNVNQNTIQNIILNILNRTDTAWFYTRDKTTCKSCIFTHICPPISNYEYAIGKNNLCNVKY